MNLIRPRLVLVLTVALAGPAAGDEPPLATAAQHPSAAEPEQAAGAQTLSPWLFGQNYWMEQGAEGGRPGYLHLLWPRVTESGVKLVRIGGNAYEHDFPTTERLARMVRAVRAAGAEPLVQVPSRFTAAEATALVRRLNASGATRVRFWSIGNEPLLRQPDIIDKVHAYLTRIAPAMKKADPAIKIFVFDECEMRRPAFEALCGGRLDITGKNPDGTWTIDGFTFHRYPLGKEFTREDVVVKAPADIRRQAAELVELMRQADQKHGRTGDARLSWGLTEVNVTWANPDRRIEGIGNPSFLGGQFLAEAFGIGMELGAFTVAPWCISETDHAETDFGYLGLPPDFRPRSGYHHMQMLARHMAGSFLASRTSDAGVKAIASRGPSGIAVMVLNETQDRDLEYDLALSKDTASTNKPLVVHVDAGLPLSLAGRLPRETTTLLVLDAEGRPQLQYIYGRQHNAENRPPEVHVLSGAAVSPTASAERAVATSAGQGHGSSLRGRAVSTAPEESAVVSGPADSSTQGATGLHPRSFVPAGYKGVPFGDERNPRAPQRIPGRLQCELYDVGGPEITFHDTDGRNSGSSALNPLDGTYLHGFRAGEAVDTSFTKDRGTPTQDWSEFNLVKPELDSLYVGWTEPGEWVSYTVQVEKTGKYSVDLMYTSNGEGGIELSVDGTPRGNITLPTTHVDADPVAWRQWHHWNKVVGGLELELEAGLHLVRIKLLAANANLDYLEFRAK